MSFVWSVVMKMSLIKRFILEYSRMPVKMQWYFFKNHNHTLNVCPPGEVHMPSGKTAQPEIIDNKDGTVTVKYSPTEAGLHEMHIKYNGSHIPGQSPGLHNTPSNMFNKAHTHLLSFTSLGTINVVSLFWSVLAAIVHIMKAYGDLLLYEKCAWTFC